MSATVVRIPAFGANGRRRAPWGTIQPVQLLGCEPDKVDHSWQVVVGVVDFDADARDSGPTYVIGVDSSELEVAQQARPNHARKPARYGFRRPTAALQGGNLNAFFCRPLLEFIGGDASDLEGSVQVAQKVQQGDTQDSCQAGEKVVRE